MIVSDDCYYKKNDYKLSNIVFVSFSLGKELPERQFIYE